MQLQLQGKSDYPSSKKAHRLNYDIRQVYLHLRMNPCICNSESTCQQECQQYSLDPTITAKWNEYKNWPMDSTLARHSSLIFRIKLINNCYEASYRKTVSQKQCSLPVSSPVIKETHF